MTDAAIISGSLVDVRNIGTDKCVKLTIHVSAELAMQVLNAFGWPTNVSPVAVAIARLNSQQGAAQPQPVHPTIHPTPAGAVAKSYAQQIAIMCDKPSFQKFLAEHYQFTYTLGIPVKDAAADQVRMTCDVDSRRDILEGTVAGNRWLLLRSAYEAWMKEPAVVA